MPAEEWSRGAACRVQVATGQEALEKKLGLLETHQKEVHDSLVSIEAEAGRMYQVQIPLADFQLII